MFYEFNLTSSDLVKNASIHRDTSYKDNTARENTSVDRSLPHCAPVLGTDPPWWMLRFTYRWPPGGFLFACVLMAWVISVPFYAVENRRKAKWDLIPGHRRRVGRARRPKSNGNLHNSGQAGVRYARGAPGVARILYDPCDGWRTVADRSYSHDLRSERWRLEPPPP